VGEIPERWLEEINRRMSDAGVPYIQRPFLALRAWSMEKGIPVAVQSQASNRVHEWFYRNSPPESHHIGPLFTGMFFYDVYFWPVVIPLLYGRANLDAFTSLKSMPEAVKAHLRNDTRAGSDYLALWADCVDYGLGRDEITRSALMTEFAAKLFASANAQLDATVAVLRERRPNSKAMDSARLATEMFLKTFLAAHDGLTELGAKKLGHNLEAVLRDCLKARPVSELSELQGRIRHFPTIGSRYEGVTYPHADLWHAYGTAQFAGSAMVRSMSDRDMRRTVTMTLTNHAKQAAP
jgi:hypothetical protein